MLSRRTFVASGGAAVFAPAIARASDAPLKLRDLYAGDGISDLAQSFEGKRITVQGFMAPPLKAQMRFFVLTKLPMSVCPFCESDAEWPNNILAIYTKRVVEVVPFNVRIESRGILELGSYTDPETGFVSLVRLADSTYS